MTTTDDLKLTLLLKANGLKVTPLRVAVLRVFQGLKAPVGVPEVFEKTKKVGANYVSVHRTVQTFAEKGIVREINLRHGHADYEIADEGDHHHIVCTCCGKVEDFTGCGAGKLIRQALKPHTSFHTITDHSIELFGVCKTCAAA